MSGKNKKKKRNIRQKLKVSMGDTVKLTKGRIGLIRFIGKTQFGLGEWIGIELYNELIKTRHNGAVIGKRYFRCPPHRGIFVRRSLIKENIAVLDIQNSINNLRKKEKKMKDERRKKLKAERDVKKIKNEEKRESKRLKLAAKYRGNNNNPKQPEIPDPIKTNKKTKTDKNISTPNNLSFNTNSRRNRDKTAINRSRSANPPNAVKKDRPKTPKTPKKVRPKTPRKRPKTPTLKNSTSTKEAKRNKKRDKKKRNNSNPTNKKEIDGYYEEEENDDIISSPAPLEMAVAEPLIVRKCKVKHNNKKENKTRTKKAQSTETKSNIKQKMISKPNRIKSASTENLQKTGATPIILMRSTSNPTPTPEIKGLTTTTKDIDIDSPILETVHDIDHDSSSEGEPEPEPEPQCEPEPNGSNDILSNDILSNDILSIEPLSEVIESDDYKLQGFNTKFKQDLDVREAQNSLQLLFKKKRMEQEKKKLEDKKKNSPKTESPHQKKNSINIFNNDELPPVIFDYKEQIKNDMKKKDNMSSPKLIPKTMETNNTKNGMKTLMIKHVDNDPDLDANYDWDCNKVDIWKKEKTMATKRVKRVCVDDNDGILESDEDSLNEEEEGSVIDDDYESDSELKKELEVDFDERSDYIMHKVLDEYTHTIDDIEEGRKKLANKFVIETKRRKSRGNMGGNMGSASAAAMVAAHKKEKLKKINPNLMMAGKYKKLPGMKKKEKKQFDSARSRRASSFVDDYNLNDTLFFDGAEENEQVHDPDQFYVDTMGSDDDEDDTKQDIIKQNYANTDLGSTPVIEEEEEEEEMTETETEMDPLLGTMEDILEDDEDEEPVPDDINVVNGNGNSNNNKISISAEMANIADIEEEDDESLNETEEDEEEEVNIKIFDIEKDTLKEKVVIFYEELSEFLEWEPNENGYGMKINKITKNDYGKALFVETGVEIGWNITIINDDDITEMMRTYISSRLRKCNVKNGYKLTFKRNEEKEEIKDRNINNLKPSVYMKTKKKLND